MNHFTMKLWLLCTVVAIAVWLVFGGAVASGQTPQPGSDDIVITGFLGCGNPGAGVRECPLQIHYVNLTAGKMYAMQATTSEFNSRLVLENMKGAMLACDTDYYDDLYGRIVFRAPATGAYRLKVSATNPVEGYYTLAVRELPVFMNVTGELTPSNPARNGAFRREYEIAMAAGRRYIIDLQSDDFESFLMLENWEGAIVAFDDECGMARNTRVVFTPTRPEIFRIVATSYEPGAMGAFRLMVCEE